MMNNEKMSEGKKFEEGVENLTNLVMEASVCIFPTNDRIHSLKCGAQKSEWGMDVLSKDEYLPKAIHK